MSIFTNVGNGPSGVGINYLKPTLKNVMKRNVFQVSCVWRHSQPVEAQSLRNSDQQGWCSMVFWRGTFAQALTPVASVATKAHVRLQSLASYQPIHEMHRAQITQVILKTVRIFLAPAFSSNTVHCLMPLISTLLLMSLSADLPGGRPSIQSCRWAYV